MKPLFFIILVRDIKLVGRNPGESAATTVIFFVIVATLFSFAANTDLAMLRVIGPTVVWVAALLSAMLSLDSIFQGRLCGWHLGPTVDFSRLSVHDRACQGHGSLDRHRIATDCSQSDSGYTDGT